MLLSPKLFVVAFDALCFFLVQLLLVRERRADVVGCSLPGDHSVPEDWKLSEFLDCSRSVWESGLLLQFRLFLLCLTNFDFNLNIFPHLSHSKVSLMSWATIVCDNRTMASEKLRPHSTKYGQTNGGNPL